MIKVFLGIPSLGSREDAQCYFLRDLEKKYKDKIELVYPKQFVGRIFHDFARNAYVDEFLASGCDVLWFLDSDVVPPINALDLITEDYDKWDLAGCPYPVWMTPDGYAGPQAVFTVYNRREDGRFVASVIPDSGRGYVNGIATGCIFIKRHVFEKIQKPYFEFSYNQDTRQITEGEDLGFCRKVSDAGYTFYIDFSMVCKHYKKVCLLEVNNYAMDYAHKAIEGYVQRFKSEYVKSKLGLDQKPKSSLILPDTKIIGV